MPLVCCSCGVVWSGAGEEEGPLHRDLAYVCFIYTGGFLLPLAVISTSYIKIIR